MVGRDDDYGRDSRERSPPFGRRGGKGGRRDSRSRSRRRSPPRRGSRSPRRGAFPGPARGFGGRGGPERGGFKVTIENIPRDMSWAELKDFGHKYVKTVTFARTFSNRDEIPCGVIEVKEETDVEKLHQELSGRRIQGCSARLRVLDGDLSKECRRY